MKSLHAQATSAEIETHWDEDALWQRVLARDEESDGAFVYGVRTTRIFCRASCPSRRPLRENACFFASPEEASGAGFRACKRCCPEQPTSAVAARIQHACRLLEASESFSLDELSQAVGSSTFHLQRTFKRMMGMTPRQYAQARRLQRLKAGLQEGQGIAEALYEAGYGSSRALYEAAPAQLGMTPATYKRGGQGARIGFFIAPCPLGFLLVAATPHGLCSISLGDSPEALEAALRTEFFAAEVQPDEARLSDWMQSVLQLLKGEAPPASLPLDVRATAFQWRVWQALQQIEAGQTRTYSQVALAIGQPSAVRAVARACATNPVALIVPCHRVVREGGAMAGYRWGLERKRKLLDAERARQEVGSST